MKRWNICQPDITLQKYLQDSLLISPIISQLLINRGIHDIDKIKAFLNSNLSELYNPFLMEGMHEAVSHKKGPEQEGKNTDTWGL